MASMVSSEANGDEEGEGMLEEEGAIQISLTPQLHALMIAKHTHRSSCCPQLFERAAKSWWNPRFDSDILEQQYIESSLPKLTLRFRYALLFVFLSSLVWSIYWALTSYNLWKASFGSCVLLCFTALFLLAYTYSSHYQTHQFILSCGTSSVFMVVSLLPFILYGVRSHLPASGNYYFVAISPPTVFTFYVEILLLVYTIIPLPLYIVIALCCIYSIVFETLSVTLLNDSAPLSIMIRFIMHICIHLIGAHIMIMNEVRMRGTFMSVGQSMLVRRQYEMEKALKETMINSVMPPKVAEWLMQKAHSEELDNSPAMAQEGAPTSRKASSVDHDGKIALHPEGFRPFNMNVMDNVSILFADIVGFTRMSSNKTAEHLVGLLNDLFGRFDDLCSRCGCEKINTLGDCYYAVSGCPEPRLDHAECCVNMGLAMIEAIKQFDADTDEDVNMRVGVHTGKVLCGIVGTMRFKFDVWSQDVTLANRMESTGKPGYVHITDDTRKFLKPDAYIIEEGPVITDHTREHKTYFIPGMVGGGVYNESSKPKDPCLPSVASSPITKYDASVKDAVAEKKSCSLPNMLDTVIDMKGKAEDGDREESSKSNLDSEERFEKNGSFSKLRYSFNPNIDQILRLKLPKLNRQSIDRAKPKTTSLPKILSRTVGSNEKANECGLTVKCNAASNLAPHHFLTPSSSPSSPVPPPPSPQVLAEEETAETELKDPRKDSGIRSRRSSTQDQLFSINGLNTSDLLVHRVNDYFSTSHSTAAVVRYGDVKQAVRFPSGAANLNDCEKKFLQMRKKSDLQMIKCVQRERNRRSHVMMSPLSPLTLFFVDPEVEKQYRLRAHRPRKDEPRTLASTLYNTYFDLVVTFLVYLAVNISLSMLFGWSIVWGTFFIISLIWHLLALLLCLYKVMVFSRLNSDYSNALTKLYGYLTKWELWHAFGASLLCLPLASVFANFSCQLFSEQLQSIRFFCYIAAVSIIHFCNFTQLNCWMKNILASIGTVSFLLMLRPFSCPVSFLNQYGSFEHPEGHTPPVAVNASSGNISDFTVIAKDKMTSYYFAFHLEIIIAYAMLLVLVWLLNREFEIGYRLSFYGYIMAMKDKVRVQSMKNQAEWLLHNIIPKHVVDTFKSKTSAKYSKNHKHVGVMFASIVNFNELYSEDYSSGKEYMRFLNELVGDFDELLTQEKFRNIEKIKTIGSTYMAASGLNSQLRLNNAFPNQHICDLVDFAKEMFRVVDSFNQNMIGFRFILRIGLNCGDVTAGVIGTTKLFYDIWGDAVNISSRMDSTGVHGYIQVTEECARILRPLYPLKHRGSVYVKGKDDMDVFLVQVQAPDEEGRDR